MATNTPSYVQADLADGTITRILGGRVIEGDLWVLTLNHEGEQWAYAPMHVTLATGEIARQV